MKRPCSAVLLKAASVSSQACRVDFDSFLLITTFENCGTRAIHTSHRRRERLGRWMKCGYVFTPSRIDAELKQRRPNRPTASGSVRHGHKRLLYSFVSLRSRRMAAPSSLSRGIQPSHRGALSPLFRSPSGEWHVKKVTSRT